MEQQVLEMVKESGTGGYGVAVIIGVVWVLRELKSFLPASQSRILSNQEPPANQVTSIFKTQTKVTAIETNLSEVQKQIEATQKQVQDLHDWHAKEDENGVKIWYNKPAIERMLTNMESSSNELAREMKGLCSSLKEFISRLKED